LRVELVTIGRTIETTNILVECCITFTSSIVDDTTISGERRKAGFIIEPTTATKATVPKTTKLPPTTVRQPTISIQRDPHDNFREAGPYTSTVWDTPISVQDTVEPIRVTTSQVSEGAPEMDPSSTTSNAHQSPIERIIAAMNAQVDHLFSQVRHDEPCVDLLSMEAIVPEAETDQQLQHPLLAMAATNDPDTLYYHEAMKAPDKADDGCLDNILDDAVGVCFGVTFPRSSPKSCKIESINLFCVRTKDPSDLRSMFIPRKSSILPSLVIFKPTSFIC
jgi:hypothetical protein